MLNVDYVGDLSDLVYCFLQDEESIKNRIYLFILLINIYQKRRFICLLQENYISLILDILMY